MSHQHFYSPPQREVGMSTATTSASDSAFEPQAAYMFDEPSADEEARNTKRNIASINLMGDDGSHIAFDPTHGLAPSVEHRPQHSQPDTMNPFMFDHQNASSGTASWQTVQALSGNTHALFNQSDILNGRSDSVSQHYGQITPPEDAGPDTHAAVNHKSADTTAHATSISRAKSERARNAANQRHAKAKSAGKSSGRIAEIADDQDEEVDGKREKYREKNRLAAAKCRAKKKVNTEDLEQSAREANTQNNRLRAEERHLRDMFSSLRDQALAHDPTQGCTCSAVHSYNMHQAQRAVRGAGFGFQPGTLPSPSLRSTDDASSPTTIASSRAQSFSSMRVQFPDQAAREGSVGNQMGYLPTTMGDMRQLNFDFGASNGEAVNQKELADDGNFPEYLQQSSDSQRMHYEV